MTRFLSLYFLLILPVIALAQTDREFWFAAPEISYELIAPSPVITTGLDRPITLKVSTFETGTVVTVDQPANPAFAPIIQNIIPGTATIINLTPFIDMVENKPANTILNYGIRIRSTKPVCVIYSVCHPMSSAIYTLMGRNGLGQEFIIPMQSAFDNHAHANPPARDCFDVVATQNNTTVTVVPSKPLVGHAALDTFSVVLNRGQSWEGRATNENAAMHPGGTFVFADKPIAVTVTEDLLYVPLSDSSFDIAGDQLIPRERSGKEYFPAIGNNQMPTGNRLYIYAFENNTIQE
jgi:hypothetical protein